MTWVGGDGGLTHEELYALNRVLRLVALAAALVVATLALLYATGIAGDTKPGPQPLQPAPAGVVGER